MNSTVSFDDQILCQVFRFKLLQFKDERLSQHLQLPPQHIQVSGNSSVPSTSDEEVGRRRVLLDGIARRMDRLRGAETAGDTSTLDSVQVSIVTFFCSLYIVYHLKSLYLT